MTEPSTFQLEPHCGKDALASLLAFLMDNRGQDIRICAKDNKSFTGYQIELLLSSYKQWQSDGHKIEIVGTEQGLVSRMVCFGLPPQLFSEGG